MRLILIRVFSAVRIIRIAQSGWLKCSMMSEMYQLLAPSTTNKLFFDFMMGTI